MQELLRQIAKVINDCKYKFQYKIFFNDMEGSERPSFLIYFISGVNQDINYATTEDNILIQVVYFAPYTKGKLPNRVGQSETIDTLKKAFNKQMMFKTDSCTAKIKQQNVGYTADEDIYLQLQLEIFNLREFDEEIVENMEDININYNKN